MKECTKWMWRQIMLHAEFWSILFISAATPVTHKFMMENVSSQLIAIKGMVMSVGIILINSSYNKWGEKIFKYYQHITVLEFIAYCAIIPAIAFGWMTPKMYYILIAFVDIVLCRTLICGNNTLRRFTYNRTSREQFDNCRPIVESAACIIGNLIAMIEVPMVVSWGYLLAGVVISDILLYIAYKITPKVEQ